MCGKAVPEKPDEAGPVCKHDDSYGHVLKYTSLFGGVQGIVVLLSIVRNKFIAILLGSFGVGLIDMYNKSMDLISRSTTFGLGVSAVRRLSELFEAGDAEGMRQQVCVIRSWSVVTAILGFVVCLLFSPLISRFGFDTYDYTLRIMLLSPLVAMLALTGGELAIMKAVRQLKSFAVATILGAVSTLLISVPLYFLFHDEGIVPALLLSTFFVLLINLHFSLKLFRWQARPFSLSILHRGRHMISQGIPFVLAGVVTAGAEMMVRAFIVNSDGLAAAGFYCAGFMLIDAYARFLFTSMDADFYPRLSAIAHDVKRQNDAINRQIEVCLLLIAPFLIIFSLFVPIIVRLLFTTEFLKVVPMVLSGTFYLYFKAITTPVAYLPLAKGDSVMYFTMETLYCVFFVCILTLGYSLWGLTGAGIALSVSNLFDMLMICTVYHLKYGYRFSMRVIVTGAGQAVLLILGVYAAYQNNLWLKYLCGIPVFAVSTVWAVRTLSKETEFVSAIRRRFCRK